jgi:hypothetical protein
MSLDIKQKQRLAPGEEIRTTDKETKEVVKHYDFQLVVLIPNSKPIHFVLSNSYK